MKKYFLLILFAIISCLFVIISVVRILTYSNPNRQIELPSNKLIVMSSLEDEQIVSGFFKQKNRFLPLEEDFYDIEWISPDLFNDYKDYPGLLMVKNNSREDTLFNKVFDRIFKNRKNNSKVNVIENNFSENQIILGIEALDSLEIVQILNDYSKSIDKIDSKIENHILEKYKRIPENKQIIKKINDLYSIDLFIDHDYKILKYQSDILWIGRGKPEFGDPYRWLIFSEIDEHYNLEDRILSVQNTFNELMSESNLIKVSNFDDSKTYEYMHNNNYIIGGIYTLSEIIDDGLGVEVIPSAGGPYVAYILKRDNKRDLMMIGLVNNPGKGKMIYLKQIESVFKNIK